MTQIEIELGHQLAMPVGKVRDAEHHPHAQEVREDEVAVQAELLRALAQPLPQAPLLRQQEVKIVGSPARVGPGGWRNGRR